MQERAYAMSRALEDWLLKNGINKVDLFCLAYVAPATLSRVIRGSNYVPTQYRVYLVTGLPEFKLDQAQQEKYDRCVSLRKEEYWEEKICKYFIEKWKITGKLPELEYRLYTSSNNSQNRAELTEKIKKQLLTLEVPVPIKEVEQETGQVVQIVDTLKDLDNQLLELLTSGTESEVAEFAKLHKRRIAKLYGHFGVLLDPRPYNAATNIREMKKAFN